MVDLKTAAHICHPYKGDEMTADIMRNVRGEIDRVRGLGWADALRDLETAQINARGYLRGMMDPEALAANLMAARAACCKMLLILEARGE